MPGKARKRTARPRPSWEDDDGDAVPRPARAWEIDEPDEPPSPPDSSDDDDEDEPHKDPADMFLEFMEGLLLTRALSAHDYCVAMHLAGAAGIDKAKPFGYKPAAPSGHYLRHVKRVHPAFVERYFLYHFPIPSVGEDGSGRALHEFSAMLAHEAVHENWSTNPSMRVARRGSGRQGSA